MCSSLYRAPAHLARRRAGAPEVLWSMMQRCSLGPASPASLRPPRCQGSGLRELSYVRAQLGKDTDRSRVPLCWQYGVLLPRGPPKGASLRRQRPLASPGLLRAPQGSRPNRCTDDRLCRAVYYLFVRRRVAHACSPPAGFPGSMRWLLQEPSAASTAGRAPPAPLPPTPPPPRYPSLRCPLRPRCVPATPPRPGLCPPRRRRRQRRGSRGRRGARGRGLASCGALP